uniref:RNA polymerase-associated protein LEO1 n=1 Tax=Neospora caninum (strain Liverpool) TaxID=572307 RepID=A0A0F7UJX1_NEOCL|nr:TPA: RNA polymerase-associated protein LEO1 [Neospora caninum Liverpool]
MEAGEGISVEVEDRRVSPVAGDHAPSEERGAEETKTMFGEREGEWEGERAAGSAFFESAAEGTVEPVAHQSLATEERKEEPEQEIEDDQDLFGEGKDEDLFGEEDDELEQGPRQLQEAHGEVEPDGDIHRGEAGNEEMHSREERSHFRDGTREGDEDGRDELGDEDGRYEADDEVQEVELPFQEFPPSTQDAKVVVLRLPPTVSVKVHGAPSATRSRAARPGGISADDKFTIEWGHSGTRKKDGEESTADEKEILSNCKLVEWDDGSYSLFIGPQMFDVQVKHDPTLFFENSNETIKTLHCRAESRFQVRLGELLNFREFFSQRNMRYGKKRRAALTTQEQIERAEQMTRKTVERRHEAARTRRRQAESARGAERGLTRHFLEADSEEEEEPEEKEADEDGSLAKIKEQYKRQKRYK